MESEEYQIQNPHRGEQYYYVHQQILARYYLERLSNNMGEIPYFDWDWEVETGYYPSLQYPNGMYFPVRPSNVELYKPQDGYQSHSFYYSNFTWSQSWVQDYEQRIRDAIDQGFIWTEEGEKLNLYDEQGFEVLGDLIEANPDSPNSRYYGAVQIFARYVLGYSYYPLDKYKIAPSALQHFETSLRDPIFYQFYKRIVMYFQKYKSQLPAYKYEQLEFPGVDIVDVKFDKLYTYFEDFYTDLSYSVFVNKKEFIEESFQVRAQQDRLTYKPFSYNIHVKSDKKAKAMVRVFIGPKYDEYGREINITFNRLNFVEFDRFTYDLTAGDVEITRTYQDNWYAKDFPSYKQLYQSVSAALEGKQEFHIYQQDQYYGFPTRFLLPKGSEEGTTYQFFVMVSPYQPEKLEEHTEWYWPTGFEQKYVDQYAYGYPFDRPINNEWTFNVPNVYFEEVDIYHFDDVKEINSPHHFAN